MKSPIKKGKKRINVRRFLYRWFGWAEKRRLAKEADERIANVMNLYKAGKAVEAQREAVKNIQRENARNLNGDNTR